MQRVLFLDDMLWRHETFRALSERFGDVELHQAYSADQAIGMLEENEYDQVFLDHDLSEADIMVQPGEESTVPTGMAVVDHILGMTRPPPRVVIHSCNGPAAVEMQLRLESCEGVAATRLAFPMLARAVDLELRSRGR